MVPPGVRLGGAKPKKLLPPAAAPGPGASLRGLQVGTGESDSKGRGLVFQGQAGDTSALHTSE